MTLRQILLTSSAMELALAPRYWPRPFDRYNRWRVGGAEVTQDQFTGKMTFRATRPLTRDSKLNSITISSGLLRLAGKPSGRFSLRLDEFRPNGLLSTAKLAG